MLPGDVFVRSDEDRSKLASLDVDLLCGVATNWVQPDAAVPPSPPLAASQQRLSDRVAGAIADLLRESAPLPIVRIRSQLYGRFIGHASVDAVIERDNQQRFVRLNGGVIGLRDSHATPEMVVEPLPRLPAPRRYDACSGAQST